MIILVKNWKILEKFKEKLIFLDKITNETIEKQYDEKQYDDGKGFDDECLEPHNEIFDEFYMFHYEEKSENLH